MSEESMENFQGIHASVITALRCSKTRVWNSRRPPDFQPDSRAPYPEFRRTPDSGLECHHVAKFQTRNSTGLQNSNPGICRTPELRTRNPPESGIPRLSYPEFRWTPAGIQTGPGIPLEFHRNSGPIFTRAVMMTNMYALKGSTNVVNLNFVIVDRFLLRRIRQN